MRKLKGFTYRNLLNDRNEPISTAARAELPQWRQFSENQKLHIYDYCLGIYLVDNTTAFSIRPPELRCVDSLFDYLRWFTRSSTTSREVAASVFDGRLLDGIGHCVRVRVRYVKTLHEYLIRRVEECGNQRDDLRVMVELYARVRRDIEGEVFNSNIVRNHVDMKADRACVVVPSPVSTSNRKIHVPYFVEYGMGQFETEMGLNECGNFPEALALAGLLPDGQNVSRNDAKRIVKRYVLEDLAFAPVNCRQFSSIIKVLREIFIETLCRQEIVDQGMPLVTQRSIQARTSAELLRSESANLENLISALHTQCGNAFPGRDVLMGIELGGDIYMPQLHQLPGQSNESHREQRSALLECCQAISYLNDPECQAVKNILILGPPGAGKTHVMLMSCMYALALKLRVCLTAVTSERARLVGGVHLHLLFGMSAHSSMIEGSPIIAERVLMNLLKSPLKMAYLQRLDVLFFEEIGLLSSILFAVIDIVLQRIRQSKKPFGGLLLICTGDHRQLRPIEGRAIWTSMTMRVAFKVYCLKHLVRARNDEALQRIIEVLRKPCVNQDEMNEIIDIFSRQTFVNSWADVPNNYLRVVGKKETEKLADQYLDSVRNNVNIITQEHVCVDEAEVSIGNWQEINEGRVQNALTRKIL